VNELVKIINQIGITEAPIRKEDLVKPTPVFAQELIFTFLRDFMAEGFLDATTQRASLATSSVPAALVNPLALSVICRRFFIRIGFHDLTFGLSDLTKPDPARFRMFMKHLANFWVFADANYEATDEIVNRVEGKAAKAKEIKGEQEKMAKGLESLKLERESVMIANDGVEREIEVYSRKIEEAKEEGMLMQQKTSEVKEELMEAQAKEKDLDEKLAKLDKEQRRLQQLVKCDKVKQDLECELQVLKKDHQRKELEIQNIGRDLQEYEAKLEEFKGFHGELRTLSDLKSKIVGNVKECDRQRLEKQAVLEQRQELTDELASLHKQIQLLEAELSTEQNAWNKKRLCLQTQIKDYQNELKVTREGKTQEEIASADLQNQIAKLSKEIEVVTLETKAQEEKYAKLIRRLTDAYKQFEQEFKQTMQEKLGAPRM